MSLQRPTTSKQPSASRRARSPVWNQPSANAGASRLAVVAAHQVGPRAPADLARRATSARTCDAQRRRGPALPACASASSGPQHDDDRPGLGGAVDLATGTPRAWKASISARGTIDEPLLTKAQRRQVGRRPSAGARSARCIVAGTSRLVVGRQAAHVVAARRRRRSAACRRTIAARRQRRQRLDAQAADVEQRQHRQHAVARRGPAHRSRPSTLACIAGRACASRPWARPVVPEV